MERVAHPLLARTAAKAELAGRAEREAKDLVVVRLVAMPPDADTDVVFRAEHLADARRRQVAETFDRSRDLCQPIRYRLRLQDPLHRIIVAEAERDHPPIAFESAELKRLQRQFRNPGDQL